MLKKIFAGFLFITLLAVAGLLSAGKSNKKEDPAIQPACSKTKNGVCEPKATPWAPSSTLDQLSSQFISLPIIYH